MSTLHTHAVTIAKTFGRDSAAVAARVAALYAAHEDGVTGGKSIGELAAEATDVRIAAAYPNLSRADYAPLRTDDRYRVGKSTLAMYSLAASVIRDMGLAPSDLKPADVHAVFRTTANKSGVAEYRRDAVAGVLALPATERAGAVFGLFDAAYSLYREDAKQPEPTTKRTADVTPVADVADVERTATADVLAAVAAVTPSAEVLVESITRAVTAAADLSDADALRVFDALDAAWQALAPRIDALTATV